MTDIIGAWPAATTRFFSWEEANRTLPLVRRIVGDIRRAHEELQPVRERFRRLVESNREAGPEARALRRELDDRARRLNAFVDELQEVGCHFKGFDEGLVDYYSMRDGRPVLLCWRHGEPEIAYWHDIDGGFAGRRSIAVDERDSFRSA
jgi:hypothetical protein